MLRKGKPGNPFAGESVLGKNESPCSLCPCEEFNYLYDVIYVVCHQWGD